VKSGFPPQGRIEQKDDYSYLCKGLYYYKVRFYLSVTKAKHKALNLSPLKSKALTASQNIIIKKLRTPIKVK
jgi:hypothetical protein